MGSIFFSSLARVKSVKAFARPSLVLFLITAMTFIAGAASRRSASYLQTSCDSPDWAGGFGVPGLDGVVHAVTVSGSDVYVLGDFTQASGVKASRIAKWDGRIWSEVGGGLPLGFGSVRAIAVSGSNVYVGGSASFNSVFAGGIARWDGTRWSGLPISSAGLPNDVEGLAAIGNDLYVVGTLFIGPSALVQSVLKWNGSNWSEIGGGLPGFGSAIAVNGQDVYVGGESLVTDGASGVAVAKWDGSSWKPLGSGSAGSRITVNAIAVSGNNVYVGGDFTTISGVRANRVARWDGSSWSALGGANNNGTDGPVLALAVSGGDLYAGGQFISAGGVRSLFIARWSGNRGAALGGGPDPGVAGGQFNRVIAMAASEGSVYIGGDFTRADGGNALYLTRWDGDNFSELTGGRLDGLDGGVNALAVIGNDVYVGGSFTHAGAIRANGIAKWDGEKWSTLGAGAVNGVNGQVYAMAVSGTDLYVGGAFSTAGGIPAIGIAKWDGEKWSALGAGVGLVQSIAISGNTIYVGGDFIRLGQTDLNHVAKWDGTSWSSVGGGTTDSGGRTVYALAVVRNDLYAGGNFETMGGVPARAIARWGGTRWSALGSGVNSNGIIGNVYDMATDGTQLYVGGTFNSAGGQTANYVAKWDGSSWSALGQGPDNGVNDVVFALAVNNHVLYVAGYVRRVEDGSFHQAIFKWDGASWSDFGSSIEGTIRAISLDGENLYLGGDFIKAGGKTAYGFTFYGARAPRLDPARASFAASGGAGSVSVAFERDCTWTAESRDSWIRITSSPGVSGSGVVNYLVDPGGDPGLRTGSIVIAGRTFTITQTSGPIIDEARISGKKLVIVGKNFDAGAAVFLDGVRQKTSRDAQSPTTTLVGKKAGKKIDSGQTVTLQVKNGSGAESPQFSFTRP
jgi:hypothetical protein